jgi:uncharacterized protein (DUF983 family)
MKLSLTKSIWQGKCPKCRSGSIFQFPFYSITKFNVMNQACKKCGVSFMPEPGFYFGALYVSYAFTILFFIIICLSFYWLFRPAEWVYGVAIVVTSILLIPISFRYSRILFLYWFGGIGYKEYP